MVTPLQRKRSFLDERLNVSRDNELLQSFVRVNLEDAEAKPERPRVEEPKEEVPQVTMETNGKTEPVKGILQKHHGAKSQGKPKKVRINITIKKKKIKRLKNEEFYTDRDRATAVALGSKDIKQDLKIKQKKDRQNSQMPIEADPATFLGLATTEMKKGDLSSAMSFLIKAVELNPLEKNALVARSKCYILLGQPQNGLKDAEAALAVDKGFIKAIYQKAEALYYLGDFEHSLMYYHRGLKLRPDHEGFKLGVHKAQKAIENAIGGIPVSSKPSTRNPTPKCASKQSTAREKMIATPETVANENTLTTKSPTILTINPKPTVIKKPKKNSRLLRELAVDKDYLDKLLSNPNLKCKCKEQDDSIVDYIKDAVEFLNTRQEFWKQQLPAHLK